jgi:uncharacterized cupin superfamily protein
MQDDRYVGKRIDELPQLWEGFAKLVRQGLGISAFGVQIMDMPPNHVTKSHDESESGQEELYVALRGSGAVVIDDAGERLALDPDHVVRVSSGVARTLTAGEEGLRVLCVGGTPGKPYRPPEWTRGG